MKDIDLNNEAWSPIGRKKAPSSSSNSNVGFSGTFDGNDHTISGLNVTSAEVGVKDSGDLDEGNGFNQFDGYGGLFCLTVNATIKNLTVSGSVSCDSAGGIVGRAKGGTIENCVSNVTVVGDRKAGGIAAMTEISKTNGQGNIAIKNCTNIGAISINVNANETGSYAGGIIGYANDVGLVESCVNNATIGADRCGAKCTGGIVGAVTNNASIIKDCTNYGDVYAGNSYHISQNVEVYGGQILAYQGDACTLTMTTNVENGSLSGIAGFVADRRKTN